MVPHFDVDGSGGVPPVPPRFSMSAPVGADVSRDQIHSLFRPSLSPVIESDILADSALPLSPY